MIILLYGQDTYRLKRKQKEIIVHYQKAHKSGINLLYFDSDRLEFQKLQDEFRSVSMFKEKKLIIINNIISNKEFQESFLENIKNFVKSENIILFCQEGDIPKNSFFNALKKQAKCQEFKFLSGLRLRNWIKKEFEVLGAKIESSALNRLADLVGSNLWQMSGEIQKLVTYKQNYRGSTPVTPVILAKDVELLVKPKIETDIFKTIDAIALKDKRRALYLIHRHLDKGDNHLYLLAMIGFQFRNLLVVKSGSRPKMHPYVLRKTTEQARAFSLDELKKIYRKIFQADLDIKTGKKDPDTALDLFISGI